MSTDARTEPGPMVDAVNMHVLDHLVVGPTTHRALMDTAIEQDAIRRDLLDALEYALDPRWYAAASFYGTHPYQDWRGRALIAIRRARGEGGEG